MSEVVRWETDDQIGIITVNRPEQLNALDESTLRALLKVLESGAASGEIRAVIVTGAGDRAFVAGADLGSMKDMNRTEAQNWSLLGQTVFSTIEDLPKPVIAAVNGFALGGGCELALACDVRLAAERAIFGQPEVTLGMPPGFGGTYRLARVIGEGRARDLIFTGRTVGAAEAWELGLVSKVVSDDSLMEEAVRLALKIASNGPVALAHAKEAMNRNRYLSRDEATRTEAVLFGRTYDTGQAREGISAFLEKRKAEYT